MSDSSETRMNGSQKAAFNPLAADKQELFLQSTHGQRSLSFRLLRFVDKMMPLYYGAAFIFFSLATSATIEYDLVLHQHHMRSSILGIVEVFSFWAACFYALRLYKSLFNR